MALSAQESDELFAMHFELFSKHVNPDTQGAIPF
jgi:hypothetical protein